MTQELLEWILLLGRWLHITVAITWIGTSIFFMWLDRSFIFNESSTKEGHVGELWMVHGGGFYHVEKLLMGPTKVPEHLHWFKWESYWTWLSGIFLVLMIFYTGGGAFLLDSSVSNLSYWQAAGLGFTALVISWIFYDLLWESRLAKKAPLAGHALTLLWLVFMSYLLCHTLSGRAAYMHIGGMLGTWMTANVFLRIIPRQLKMVEASKKGEPVNQDWGKNAKNRSTHNTYFTLPVIFIMLSNHFPSTYGHEYNWLILLLMCAAGAAIREFFVVRLRNPARSRTFGAIGAALILAVMIGTHKRAQVGEAAPQATAAPIRATSATSSSTPSIAGTVHFEGVIPEGTKIALPLPCTKEHKGDVYSNEVSVADGRLKNVLVHITKGLEGKTFDEIPKVPVVIDQRDCLYEPRIIAARVGQTVEFVNSDDVFHNVRSIASNNENFNDAMPHVNDRIKKVFHKPEIVLQTKCSVHPWMTASIAVLDHPYFSITNAAGEFAIRDLPPGTYTLELWHETLGVMSREVTVTAQGNAPIDFTYKR